jgi:hypothetical protein
VAARNIDRPVNELSDLLQRVVALLHHAQINHMIAGSFASTYYGAVRMTQDIDIIIDPTLSTLLHFIHSKFTGRFLLRG